MKLFKKKTKALMVILFFAVACLACLASLTEPAWSNPQGGTVASGSAIISQPNSATTLIQQMTNQAIINWNSFGIGSGELTQFVQPSALAVALNRVTGVDPSIILGSLQANGRIFLINPNGILFGSGSTVDVGGLLATTLNISDQNFLSGNYSFSQGLNQTPSFVLNQGDVKAADGGFVVLVAPLVDNEGTIVANLGKVVLGGGTQAVLNFDGSEFVNFVLGNVGNASQNVTMTSQAFTDVLKQLMSSSGIIEAGSVTQQNGEVVLAGASGTVVNAGDIQANGGANINAGNVLLSSATATVLTPNSLISANGSGTSSNGGNIRIWSDGKTFFESGSVIQAQGGESGDGGFVEISDATGGVVAGTVDTSAQNGSPGQLLIDPTNIEVILGLDFDGGSDTDEPQPTDTFVDIGTITGSASNVTLLATNSITWDTLDITTANLQPNVNLTMQAQTGNILFENRGNGIRAHGTGSITLSAGGNIKSGMLSSNAGNISLSAGGNIDIVNANATTITTTSGNISLSAGGNINITNPLFITGAIAAQTTTGNIYMSANGSITIDNQSIQENNAGGNTGNISLTAGGNLTIQNSAFVSSSASGASGTVSLTAANGGITIDGTSSVSVSSLTGGDVTLLAGNDVSLGTISTPGNIGISSQNGAITRGGIIGNNITLSAATGIGTVGTVKTTTNGTLLSATATRSGAPINLYEFNGPNLVVSTNNGNDVIAFENGIGSLNFNGGTDLLDIDPKIPTNITFSNTGGNLFLNLINDPGGVLDFNASGSVLSSPTIAIIASVLNLTGPSIGSPGTPFSLNAVSAGVLNVNAKNGGVFLTATGDIFLTGQIRASQNVVMTSATGGIFSNPSGLVTAGSAVTLSAMTGIGTIGQSVVTNTPSLTATTTTASTAPIYLADQASLSSLSLTTNNSTVSVTAPDISGALSFTGGSDLLSAQFTGPALTSFGFDNTGGNIVLDSTHFVNLGTNAASAGTLTASGDIANGGTAGSITANTLTLTAGTFIGTSGSTIATVISNLTATAAGGGIYVSNTGNLALGAVTAGANTMTLTTTGDLEGSGAGTNLTAGTANLTAGTDIGNIATLNTAVSTLNAAAGGNMKISNAGNLTLGAVTAGANTVALASTGDLEGSGAGTNLTAGTANLTAGTDIGNIATLNTAVSTLNAAAGGNIHVVNATALTIGAVNATGSVNISTASGDILLDGITAGGGIFLNTAGSILNVAPPGVVDLTAGANSILTAGGVIGTGSNPLTVAVTNGTLGILALSRLGGISVDINGTVTPSNTLQLLSFPTGMVLFNGMLLWPPYTFPFLPGLPVSVIAQLGFATGGTLTPQEFFDALSQDNPYLSNSYDFSSSFLVFPIDEGWLDLFNYFVVEVPTPGEVTVQGCGP